jgi:hypothetical protein
MARDDYGPPTTVDGITSLEMCYRLADSTDDPLAARAIGFAAHKAANYRDYITLLAWACKEKNARKRNAVLQRVLMAMDDDHAGLPMRERTTT